MNKVLFMTLLATSVSVFAQGNCEKMAQEAVISLANVNKDAIGKVLTQVKSSKLVSSDAKGNRAKSNDIYAISLSSYGSAELKFTVKTGKDNDEIGLCSVESVEMEPVFY